MAPGQWILLRSAFLAGLLLQLAETILPKQEEDDRIPLAQIKELPSGPVVAEYDWTVPNVRLLLQTSRSPLGHTLYGPDFFTSRPGYKVRLRLTAGYISPTDGLAYVGLWFSLGPGPYDGVLQWPFPYSVNLTLVSRREGEPSIHDTLQYSATQCRKRPGPEEGPNEGCGRVFLVPHEHVLEGPFLLGDELLVRATVFLERKDSTPRKARIFMRGHQLVSEFLWEVDSFPSLHSPVTSQPFHLDSDGYLLQLQLTLSSDGKEVGLFSTLLNSEHDSSLPWPFAVPFELALLDRKGAVEPGAGGTCPQAAFRRPHPERPNPPCGFRRMGTLAALRARALNGSMVVARFTAVLDRAPQTAGVVLKNDHLAAEYMWRVPHIERKLQLAKADRISNLLSERFYSSSQGYLMQLQIKFQNHSLGIYLTLLEGTHDSLLKWPFTKRFSLHVIDQQRDGGEDVVVSIDPTDPYVGKEACPGSFWRPFGRNDACGSSNAVSYDQLYDRKFIRFGAILLKVVIFLDELQPPRFASLVFQENHLSARFEWLVTDLPDKIRRVREGRLDFIDSEKFYLSNNGYRMMLRLYPEKAQGYVGLYAVLTRGIYDNELRWPFPHAYRLEVVTPTGVTIQRTTHPKRGCPDIAFQRPDRELSEWSCGEGHMVAHETLLGRPRSFLDKKDDVGAGPLPYTDGKGVLLEPNLFAKKKGWAQTGPRPYLEEVDRFPSQGHDFTEKVSLASPGSNPYTEEIPLGTHSFIEQGGGAVSRSNPYEGAPSVPQLYTEEAGVFVPESPPLVGKEHDQQEHHNFGKKEGGIRFAITVFLQELTPPVASLRLEGGALVARYSWILKGAVGNLGLLQSLEKNRLESPVFYSENQGYAMRLAVSLSKRQDHRNSVSTSEDGEHVVGLYWTLHAGLHDDALQWPFSSLVTLSLVDGRGLGTSVQRVIDPRRSKCPVEAFNRPIKPHNEHSCGFAALVSLTSLLNNYIQDDILHIKAFIAIN